MGLVGSLCVKKEESQMGSYPPEKNELAQRYQNDSVKPAKQKDAQNKGSSFTTDDNKKNKFEPRKGKNPEEDYRRILENIPVSETIQKTHHPFATRKYSIFMESVNMVSRILEPGPPLDEKELERIHHQKDRYLNLEVLGTGATGEVKKARDKRRARYVAIKTYKNEEKRNALYEAKVMAGFRKIDSKESMYLTKCKKVEWSREGNETQLILVIDIGVCSLNDLIKRRQEERSKYSEREILLMLRDVARGLLVLEKLNIIHGDIKPDNILYSRNPARYMITDFGVSYFVEKDWRSEAIVSRGHTPKYLYPDEEGFSNPYKRDVWALGVSCLDMMEVFKMGSVNEQINTLRSTGFNEAFINENVKSANKYSKEFFDILKATMAKSSTERETAAGLLKSVETLLEAKAELMRLTFQQMSSNNEVREEKTYLRLEVQEESYAKKVEEYKVIKMICSSYDIDSIDGFIRDYEKLYDFNYCMRLIEKKWEIMERKQNYSQTDPSNKQQQGGLTFKEKFVRTLRDLARYCRLSQYHLSKTMKILDDYRSTLKKYHDSHPSESASYFLDLGVIYRLLGKFVDAESMLLNALRLKKRNEPSKSDPFLIEEEDKDIEVTLFLDELGQLYLEMANYEKAGKCFEKSLDIKLLLIEKSDCLTNIMPLEKAYNNMGLLYLKTWNLAEAAKTLSRNFKPGNRELRIEHINPDSAFSFALMGKIKEEEGLYKEAFNYYSNYKSILITLNITREHPDIARSCLYLGNLFERIGMFSRAITEYEEAIEICKKNSDTKDNLTLADSYSFMGSVYCKKGNFEKASYYYKKSLKKYNQIYNPDSSRPVFHQNISNIFIKEGILQEKLGKFAQAEKSLNDALEIVKQIFGDGNHPDQAVIYNNLGLINFKLANNLRAIKFHKNAISILMNVYKISQTKNYHPEIGRSMNYIGLIHIEAGNLQEARKNFETAIRTYEVFFKGNHPDKALTLLYIGLNMKKAGDFALAESKLLSCLEMLRSFIEDENHPDVIFCYRELGSVAENVKDFPKAIVHTNKSLELANNLYKSPSLDQALALKQLANIYFKLNDLEVSERNCEEALKVCKQVLNTELHPEFISILKIQLSICKKRKGPNHSERALHISERIRSLEEEFEKMYNKSLLNTVVK